MMQREQLQLSLFLLVAAVVFYLFFRIMVPYLIPICWAAVFTVIFFPLQKRLLIRMKNRNLAALLMCLLVLILIIGPLTYLFVAVVYQAADAVAGIDELYASGQLGQLLDIDWPFWQTIKNLVSPYHELTQIDLDQFVKDTIGKVSAVVLGQTTWLIANATKTVFSFGLMIFTMFYLFREGSSLTARVKRLLPLGAAQTDKAFDQLREVVQATMYGGVAVALLQGLMGGILFAAAGIDSAVFWGAVMAFLSLLPFIGAFLVYVPAGIALILAGSTVKGFIVIAIGVAVISQADNVVRPYLISGKTSMHPLLLFFAILGGITMWGLVGLVVGPMVAAAFVILIKVFEMRLHPEEPGIAASE